MAIAMIAHARQGAAWLRARLRDMVTHKDVYLHPFSTSPIESINSQIHNKAPKHKALPASYVPRADAAILIAGMGCEVREVACTLFCACGGHAARRASGLTD